MFLNAQLYIDGDVTIQNEAIVYADTDVILDSSESQTNNEGTLFLTGDLHKNEDASYQNSQEGTTFFTFSNSSSDVQHIEGDFTGENAFSNLILDLSESSSIVDVNHTIQIDNSIELRSGILRSDTISNMSDGSLYANAVQLTNTAANSLIVQDDAAYVEGVFIRNIDSGAYSFPVGVDQNSRGKQSMNLTSEVGNGNAVTVFYQDDSSTELGTITECDLGEAPNYDIPDGTIEIITIDCSLGQWVAESEFDFAHSVQLVPSEALLAECNDAELRYVGVDGSVLDCPSFGNSSTISREDIQTFGRYDIATAFVDNITTSTIDIEGTTVTTAVYPNPAQVGSEIQIKIEGIEGIKSYFSLFNMLGQQAKVTRELSNGVNTLKTGNLPSGQYIIHMNIGNTTISDLIVIR